MSTQQPSGREGTWLGALERHHYDEGELTRADGLCDAAKRGNWDAVLGALGEAGADRANQIRYGGRAWYTPLHQAAWHGADREVVETLLQHGARRSQRCAAGQLPLDVAHQRGHEHLVDLLTPPPVPEEDLDRYRAWDRQLADLVETRIRPLPRMRLRHVNTEVLVRDGLASLWMPVPGMYGGFSMHVHGGRLHVESWCRVVGGSGQAHVITADRCTLVDEGFV